MIETEDLSKQFNEFLAVDGVAMSVKPGQILGLLGQYGAGKTTIVRMVTSLLTPTRGWACVAGYDIVKRRCWGLPRWSKRISPRLFWRML